MRIDTRGKWRPPAQEATRGYLYAHPDRGVITIARCECGVTCGAHAVLVKFAECVRCGAEVPIRWDVGVG